MKIGKSIKQAATLAAIALLLLVLWCFWVARRLQSGESPFFFADGVAEIVSITCTFLALLAIGGAVFIAIKAFCAGLKDYKSGLKRGDNDVL